MKRIFILAIAVLALFSCKKDETPELNSTRTFEAQVAQDYNYMKGMAAEAFFFYEVQCQMNGTPARKSADELNVDATCTIAQIGDKDGQNVKVYFITTDLTNGSQKIDIVENDWWMGDFNIVDPTAVKITFKEAVKMLQEQKIFEVPDSDLMTFAKPTSGNIPNPRYIFGSKKTNFVYIDAVTGEIGTMKRDTAGLNSELSE